MSKFKIEPRRYKDRLEAVEERIIKMLRKNVIIDQVANPNGGHSLLQWCHGEIVRLREELKKAKEARPVLIVKPEPSPLPASLSSDPSPPPVPSSDQTGQDQPPAPSE